MIRSAVVRWHWQVVGRIGQRLYATRAAPLRLSSSDSLLARIQSSNNVQLPVGPFDPKIPCHATSTDSKDTKHDQEVLVPFFLNYPPTAGTQASPLGFLRPSVAQALLNDHHSQLGVYGQSCWSFHGKENHLSGSPSIGQVWALSFLPHISNQALRTDVAMRLVEKWRQTGMFPDILKGWSNEECPVYLPSSVDRTSNDGDSLALTIERAALPLFGFPNFGALLVGFCETGRSPGDIKLWIARRSLSKRTFPGLLDVVAGGSIDLGEPPVASAIREASEEASLPASYVAKNIRSAGSITFSHRSPAGWLLPGFYHAFELPLPADLSISPQINAKDGEVENFELLDAQECFNKLLAGKFKPSSALAILNFMVRRGLYSPEVDVEYNKVLDAMRRDLIVPIP